MGRHPPQHFYVQSILGLFHLSPLASILSPTNRMLFFTQHSSFFFSLFQLKVRNGNANIKALKWLQGTKFYRTILPLLKIVSDSLRLLHYG